MRIVLALLAVALLAAPLSLAVPVPPHPVPQAVAGFTALPLAALAVPTALAFGPGDADGPDLYATTLAGDVQRVSLAWTPAGPVATGTAAYAVDFSQPLGLAFDGDVLYVADSTAGNESGRLDGRVTRVDPDGTRTVVVAGLPNGRHNTNHLRFGPDGRLGIANGNPNDNGPSGGDADVHPYSGALLSVDVSQVSTSPAVLLWKDAQGDPIDAEDVGTHPRNADFIAKVQVLGYGFRNVFGLAWSPAGDLYTATNGADTPSSQDALYKVSPGADHGFPRCFAVGDAGAVGGGITVEPSPVFPGASCTGVPKPTALLGWHVCATGLDLPNNAGPATFPAAFRDSVYVAECGPFFPDPVDEGISAHNTGHKVVRAALDANGDAVAVEDFLTGLALPTDVLFGPDGAMYVADAAGVLRVAPLPLPTVQVQAAGTAFVPSVLVVPTGTIVEWKGVLLSHTVTTNDGLQDALTGRANDPANGDGDADTFHRSLAQGGVVRHAFTTPGTYTYHCAPHAGAGMVGTIVVV